MNANIIKIKPSLARRFIGFMMAGFACAAILLMLRSEVVLEAILLDQAKQQAHVFMLGVEAQIQASDAPTSQSTLQNVIAQTMRRDFSPFGFIAYEMYFFDAKGVILAHSRPGVYPPKTMKPEFEKVFVHGASSLGEELEYVVDEQTGRVLPLMSIIVPLRVDGRVEVALEVEVNLEKTLSLIKEIDGSYEQQMLIMISIFILIMLIFTSWVNLRWVLRPIYSIVEVTEKIAGGALSARVKHTSKDELGRLAFSVNKMADSVEQLIKEQEEAHLQMLQSLARALEAKDSYTAGHSGRVAKYSYDLGQRIGLDEHQLTMLKQGALIHDLGKIGIPDNILNKPSRLEGDEIAIMRRHPVMTAKITRPLKRFKEFAEIAAWHHEHWDGTGYPDGLKGEEIPLLARIVSIADTWDAMTGDRIYRKAISTKEAIAILEREQDSGQWDPRLIREFIAMVREE